MNLKAKIESLLFVSLKPLSSQKIAELLKAEKKEVEASLDELKKDLNAAERGIQLMEIDRKYSLSTAPENGRIIREYLQDELTGELTRPALETLTIVAYRGPISKADLDVIRGVNCALILRHLMIKGLVESYEDKEKMTNYYQVTFDFLKYLGLAEVKDLPNYDKLNQDENLQKLLHPDLPLPSENPQKTPANPLAV